LIRSQRGASDLGKHIGDFLAMALPLKLNDVIEALDEAAEECVHYLDRRTGEIGDVTLPPLKTL
jgi:hypothetical protein